MKISKKTSVAKILQELPGAKEIFRKFGLDCSGCLGADFEDLEAVAKTNQINLNKLLKELETINSANKRGG